MNSKSPELLGVGISASAHALLAAGVHDPARFAGRWEIECRGPDGAIKWRDYIDNLIVNTGLDDILDKYLKGSSYTAAHYIGLTDGTPTVAAGDTMGSHAGWAEVADYDEATRQAFTPGTVSSQSASNSASKAAFSINGTVTVGGAFCTTSNTKSGTTGTLVSAGAFSGGDRALSSGDTLNVQLTVTASSS